MTTKKGNGNGNRNRNRKGKGNGNRKGQGKGNGKGNGNGKYGGPSLRCGGRGGTSWGESSYAAGNAYR